MDGDTIFHPGPAACGEVAEWTFDDDLAAFIKATFEPADGPEVPYIVSMFHVTLGLWLKEVWPVIATFRAGVARTELEDLLRSDPAPTFHPELQRLINRAARGVLTADERAAFFDRCAAIQDLKLYTTTPVEMFQLSKPVNDAVRALAA